MSTVSPSARWAVLPMRSFSWPSRFDQTVLATSGSAAASMRSTPAGKRHHLTGRHQHLRRVAAAGEQRADLLADLAIDAFTHGRDAAAAFQPDDRRRAGRRRRNAPAIAADPRG